MSHISPAVRRSTSLSIKTLSATAGLSKVLAVHNSCDVIG